jgi:hypothetical protein
MAIDFPSSPTSGTLHLTSAGLYIYDGSAWTQQISAVSTLFADNKFLYRSIYTRGYTSNGYANGTPWKNVNRTVHTTDTTTNLGDMHSNTGSYLDGGWSDFYHYVYNVSGAVGGISTAVSSMNMATESARTPNSNWNLKTARANCGALMNPSLSAAYITAGNSSTTDKHNYATETMYAVGSAASSPSAGATTGGVSRFFGGTYGWVWASGNGGRLSWDTETWTAGGLSISTDGQPKGLSTKLGWAYCTEGSYGGANYYYKINDNTGANLATSISRPEPCGEENTQVGQYWGYTIGSYNANIGQTNNTTKTMYLTDTVTAMGSATQPKGHTGMSSGAVGTASSLILGGE